MKRLKWLGLAGLACVACCSLPLLILGAGGLAAISTDTWICGSVFLIVSLVGFWIAHRFQSQTRCASTGASSCCSGCGCKPGRVAQ
jgi:membrane protein implicated in regulation of membrane protease activity